MVTNWGTNESIAFGVLWDLPFVKSFTTNLRVSKELYNFKT